MAITNHNTLDFIRVIINRSNLIDKETSKEMIKKMNYLQWQFADKKHLASTLKTRTLVRCRENKGTTGHKKTLYEGVERAR